MSSDLRTSIPDEHGLSHPSRQSTISLCLLNPQLEPNWLQSPQGDEPYGTDTESWRARLTRSPELRVLVQRVLASGESYHGPFVLPGACGDLKLELTLAALPGVGAILGVLDPTKHQQALTEYPSRAEIGQLLSDYTFDWEYCVGPDGRLRWMSSMCESVTGYPVSAFFADAQLLESIVHPEDQPAIAAHLHGDLHTCPDEFRIRFRLLRPSGEIRWVEHVCRTLYQPDGSFAGRHAINRDITETMQVEQALRESEMQFRLMFELSTVGMALIEPLTRRVLRVNERLCKILGYDADTLLKMTFSELTHPQDREHDLVRYLRAAQQEDSTYFVEKRYVRKDGQVVWALVNATFIRDDSGQPLRTVAAIIDITDRRRAEARARELAAVVEYSSDFIGIARLDKYVLYLNQAAKALVGFEGDAIVQDYRIDDFFMPEDLPFLYETVLPTMNRTGRWSGEFRFRHFGTGEPITVFYNALRIDDPETGQPLQFATVTRDIRKEKAAEQALLEADRRKDDFLARLGHELRNPMAPIRNAVEIIRTIGIGNDPRIVWAMDVLDRQTVHMGCLLDDLLDVSRIVLDRINLDVREIELRDVVRQAVDGVQAMMRERHHHCVCDLPPASVRVEGDPVRLSQILLNILVNAARYTPDHGNIWVDYQVNKNEVVVRVRDTGQGMSAARIEAMFGAFSLGATLPDASGGGLGLGLTIARRLAELHGGKLAAFSEGPDRGTELRLHLPLLARVYATATSEPTPDVSGECCGDALRVLVVDDNPDVSGALAMLLELHGYTVETAASGPEALACVSRNQPRVAFLDIGLPGMDGLELARRLREAYPDADRLLLVALTGRGHERARELSLAAGFDEHLVKPLDQQTLLALLGRLSRGGTDVSSSC